MKDYKTQLLAIIQSGDYTHNTIRTFEDEQYNFFIQKIEKEDDALYCLFIDIEPKSLLGQIYCLYIDEYLESVVGMVAVCQAAFLAGKVHQIQDVITEKRVKVKFEDYDEEEDDEQEAPLQALINLDEIFSEEEKESFLNVILEELDKKLGKEEKDDDEELDIL